MKKIIIAQILAINLLAAGSIFAQENERFAGRITADNVNIRSGPNINFETITQLSQGDTVKVIGKETDWYRIILPAAANCYVSTKYLKRQPDNTAEIISTHVNVRSGPGPQHSILCQLDTGEKVLIREIKNEWAAIQPPGKCAGWVHKDYLKFHSTLEELETEETRQKEARQKFTRAEEQYQVISRQPLLTADYAPLLPQYQDICQNYPTTPQAEPAKQRLAEVREKIAKFNELKNTVEKQISPQAIGTIEVLGWFFRRSGTHKLIDENKKTLYLLKGDRETLDRYLHQKVKIWGSIQNLHGSKHSLITIDRIEPLS